MNKITKLTKLWYEIVSLDHHKDRDCHWYINKVWSYGNPPIYRVEHYGYVYKDIVSEFDTYKEGKEALTEEIRTAIRKEKDWALGVLKDKTQWDATDIERANNILEIFKKENKINE